MLRLISILIALTISSAWAQQPSVDDLRKVVSILQSQRNRAADEVAEANLKIMTLADEVSKLKAELEELKKKAPADVK